MNKMLQYFEDDWGTSICPLACKQVEDLNNQDEILDCRNHMKPAVLYGSSYKNNKISNKYKVTILL